MSKLAGLTRPLCNLLKKSSAWVWEEPQKTAMARLKEAMSSLPALRRFDLQLPIVLSMDASPTGLGAVLLQEGQPVAYSSTSLTTTQKRYCQIENELLAVQFCLMWYKQYVYGQQVTVETDHKPLIGLFEKPIAECSPIYRECDCSCSVLIFAWYKNRGGNYLLLTLLAGPTCRSCLMMT